jgi:hypothetical protein
VFRADLHSARSKLDSLVGQLEAGLGKIAPAALMLDFNDHIAARGRAMTARKQFVLSGREDAPQGTSTK